MNMTNIFYIPLALQTFSKRLNYNKLGNNISLFNELTQGRKNNILCTPLTMSIIQVQYCSYKNKLKHNNVFLIP